MTSLTAVRSAMGVPANPDYSGALDSRRNAAETPEGATTEATAATEVSAEVITSDVTAEVTEATAATEITAEVVTSEVTSEVTANVGDEGAANDPDPAGGGAGGQDATGTTTAEPQQSATGA